MSDEIDILQEDSRANPNAEVQYIDDMFGDGEWHLERLTDETFYLGFYPDDRVIQFRVAYNGESERLEVRKEVDGVDGC